MAIEFEKQSDPEVSIMGKAAMYPDEDGNMAAVNEDGVKTLLDSFPTSYRLVKIRTILKGTVTYTPTAGVRALLIECIGGGGAGGTAGTNNVANSDTAGGGGGGGYSRTLSITNVAGAHDVIVGAGGSAGVSAATDTVFEDSLGNVICVGKAGAAGAAVGQSAAAKTAPGAAGGYAAAATGDFKQQGNCGGPGIGFATIIQHIGGAGGKGFMGGGGGRGTNGVGESSGDYGGGGGGGSCHGTSGNGLGGDGSEGVIRVWEFA